MRQVIVFVLLIGLVAAAFVYLGYASGTLNKFNVTPDQMREDLNGQVVALPFGQGWAFEPKQTITFTVLAKKQANDYVVVSVNMDATVAVTEKPKDPTVKLPKKIGLSGLIKLTYELLGDKWYLVRVDGVSLKAVSLDQ